MTAATLTLAILAASVLMPMFIGLLAPWREWERTRK